MQYLTFGRNNGLRVSEYALGAATFGTRWGTGSDLGESTRVLDRFADAGGTFIDTAESYQAGESEEILGELLSTRRDRFTLATKFAIGIDPTSGVQGTGHSRQAMIRAVEGSLARLRTDRIDLLWVHFPDPVTPIEETLRALDDLVRSGKILYAGLSNFPAWRTARAVTLAELRGWAPIVGAQFEYSLVERSADREILPMTEALGLGATMWSPLGGGLLTGKYRHNTEGRLTTLGQLIHTEDSAQKTTVVDTVLEVADELQTVPAQVAVAWLRHRAAISTTGMVPVIGPRDVSQLDTYLAALDVQLSEDQFQRLDKVSRIPLGQPHDSVAERTPTLLGGPDVDFRPPIVPVA
ncbi:aldo/keto reductase [Streptomyces sp. CA-179760]|uniref:aldo/keto reductase n=1 Tax=Streptomyces sp. CA-179760 TaxID=3240054 RepID=UPI003D8B6B83